MENSQNVETYVNTSTGECFYVNEGDSLRIVTSKQQEAIDKSKKTKELNSEIKYLNNTLGGFIFVLFKYCNDIFSQHSEITPAEITKLFYLATYVDYDGYLIYDTGYMKRKDMNDLIGLNRNNFGAFFNKMKDLNIFSVDKNKNIKMNKSYFVKGNIEKEIKQYSDYTRVYIKTIRYLFENVSSRNHRQLGMYFKMIPYIHRQQNALCWNPESKAEDIQLMNVKNLREVLGYSKNGIKAFINEMLTTRLKDGRAIVGFLRTEYDEGKSYIIINPDVFYGGNYNIEGGRNSIIKWFNKY